MIRSLGHDRIAVEFNVRTVKKKRPGERERARTGRAVEPEVTWQWNNGRVNLLLRERVLRGSSPANYNPGIIRDLPIS